MWNNWYSKMKKYQKWDIPWVLNLKILFLLNHNQYKCLGSCKKYYFSSSKNNIKVNNWYSKMKKKSKVRHFVSNKS